MPSYTTSLYSSALYLSHCSFNNSYNSYYKPRLSLSVTTLYACTWVCIYCELTRNYGFITTYPITVNTTPLLFWWVLRIKGEKK